MALKTPYTVDGIVGTDISTGFQIDLQKNFQSEWGAPIQVSFYENNILEGLYDYAKLTSVSNKKFPLIGAAKAYFIKPGDFAPRQDFAHGSITVELDDRLTSTVTVHDIDAAAADYSFMQPELESCGKRMAELHTRRICDKHLQAARGLRNANDKTIVGGFATANPAITISGFSAMTKAQKVEFLTASAFEAKQKLDENKVPAAGRVMIVPPFVHSLFAQNLDLVNSFYGGIGSYAKGEVVYVAGFELKMMADFGLPSSDDAGNFFDSVSYGAAGIDQTLAIVTTKEAVAHIELIGFTTASERQERYFLTDYIISKVVGYGIKNNNGSIEIKEAV